MERLIREYIAASWYLLPLKPGLKVPLEGQGVDHASNDLGHMLGYLRRYPNMNIGLGLRESNILAVDVDDRSGGHAMVERLRSQGRYFPETAMSETAQNGLHYLFVRPDAKINNSSGKLPGIDIKTSGGYIVLPPSKLINTEKHRAGNYEWINEVPVARAPKWLVDILRVKEETWQDVKRRLDPRYAVPGGQGGTPEASLHGRLRKIANSADGERNNMLNTCAHYAFQDVKAGHLGELMVRQELYQAARAAGLAHEESVKTIQSAFVSVMNT